jgi:acyl-coenzyme A thioesterase PaaI-like protein
VNDQHETRASELAQSSRQTTHEAADEAPEANAPSELNPHWDPTKLSQNEMWTQKRRLATAMRLVIERLVPSNAPAQELSTAADALERYAEALGNHPRLKDPRLYGESANAGDVGAFFDQSPLIGLANPLAPPLTIGRKDDTHAQATGIFGSAYEGPPGSVHGGFIAAAFDEVLGYVQSLSGQPGMTGTLTVWYRKPTPLHTPLLFEAEFERIEGRKIFTRAVLTAKGFLCAEAEGIFVSFRRGAMKRLLDDRSDREAQLELPHARS